MLLIGIQIVLLKIKKNNMSIEEKEEEYRSDTFGTPFRNDIKMAFS